MSAEPLTLAGATTAKQIGRYYNVPCLLSKGGLRGWVPINGPLHEDNEDIGFEPQHWHIDWRFVTARQLQRATANHHTEERLRRIHGRVLCLDSVRNPEPEIRRLMMKREMPPYMVVSRIPWIGALERKFALAKLSLCLICPHRGISLAEIKPDAEGNVVCPGHGLKWNVATRSLVRQTKDVANAEQAA